jgi:GABA permease
MPPAPTVLVIANQTLGGPELRRAIEERLAEGPARFHVLVPATRQQGLLKRAIDAYAGEPDPDDLAGDRWAARDRLEHELARLRAFGAEADGEIGDADPVRAALSLTSDHDFDEIILSTLPAGASQWLSMDLPSRLERALGRPVKHVPGPAAA